MIPTSNATLRTAMLKAKAGQMTNDAIDRAIKRGTGEDDGRTYEAITYEGYAPGGVALLIDVLTDNRNRTGAEVRNIFSKLGGSMAEPGAVGWQFSQARRHRRHGWRRRQRDDGGARGRRGRRVATTATASGSRAIRPTVYDVRDALQAAGFEIESAESTMVASLSVEVTDTDDARKILRIIDAFEENEDVQDVYSNFDISDELMEAVGA